MMKAQTSTDSVPQGKISTSGKFGGDKYRDVWATILYILHFAVVGWLMYLAISHRPLSVHKASLDLKFDALFTKANVIGLFGGLGVAFGISVSALMLLSAFTQGFVKFSFFATSGLLLVMAINGFVVEGSNGAVVAFAIVALVIAAFNVLLYFWWRKRIPLASALISTATAILKKNPAGWFVVGGALFLDFLLLIGYVAAMVLYRSYADRFDRHGWGYVYLGFSMFWTSQVIQNIAQTTNAGLFASHYFVAATGGALVNPTMSSFVRAITFSFGSICFGSLVIAVISALRLIVGDRRQKQDSLVLALLSCLLSLLGDVLEYLNYYTFIHVAIYGKSFIGSAKGVWNLVKSSGFDVIVNDVVVDKCLGMMVFFVAVATGLVTFLFTNIIFVMVAVIASIVVSMVLLSPISTGVSTTFVCMAENRSIIANTESEMYRKLANAYPAVFSN